MGNKDAIVSRRPGPDELFFNTQCRISHWFACWGGEHASNNCTFTMFNSDGASSRAPEYSAERVHASGCKLLTGTRFQRKVVLFGSGFGWRYQHGQQH
jgi:hypothetical protein